MGEGASFWSKPEYLEKTKVVEQSGEKQILPDQTKLKIKFRILVGKTVTPFGWKHTIHVCRDEKVNYYYLPVFSSPSLDKAHTNSAHSC